MTPQEATNEMHAICSWRVGDDALKAESVRTLIEDHGADVNSWKMTEHHWYSTLHRAADSGLVECCRVLLEHGADVNAQAIDAQGIDNKTPLTCAILSERGEVVRLLLEHGADPDIPNGKGWVPREQEMVQKAMADMAQKTHDRQMRAALKKRSRFEPRPDNLDRSR